MARPRTPTRILDARGSFKKNPDRKRDGEPEVTDPIGAAPGCLSPDEVVAWNDIVAGAPIGVLTSADALAVETAAGLLAELRSDRVVFAAGKHSRLQSYFGQFGMTPADRAKLSIEKPSEPNPFDMLI